MIKIISYLLCISVICHLVSYIMFKKRLNETSSKDTSNSFFNEKYFFFLGIFIQIFIIVSIILFKTL
jgi:hypothetical protein